MISVAFARTSLSLDDLVIDNDPFTGDLYMAEDGVGVPGWDYRRTYAPDSVYIDGKALIAAVRDASTLPLSIYAHAASSAALATAQGVLEAAVSQWSYDVTVTVDGVATTYHAEPAIPAWGAVDSGMVAARLARCQLVIPVNP